MSYEYLKLIESRLAAATELLRECARTGQAIWPRQARDFLAAQPAAPLSNDLGTALVQVLEAEQPAAPIKPPHERSALLPCLERLSNALCQSQAFVLRALEQSGLSVVLAQPAAPARTETETCECGNPDYPYPTAAQAARTEAEPIIWDGDAGMYFNTADKEYVKHWTGKPGLPERDVLARSAAEYAQIIADSEDSSEVNQRVLDAVDHLSQTLEYTIECKYVQHAAVDWLRARVAKLKEIIK
jgi:hypothetical protein